MPTTAQHERTPAAVPAPRKHTTGLVGALNAQWQCLAADQASEGTLRRWRSREPAFSGLRDLNAVLDAAALRGDDCVLKALLRLAREGDPLATRTALQVMLGAAVRLARRTVAHAGGDLEESLARAVGVLWDVVRAYPLERRSCRPADGISLDVLAALTTGGRARFAEVPAGLPAELGALAQEVPSDDDETGTRGLFWSRFHPRAEGACADEQLILLLAWGVRAGVVALDDARLLLRLNSPEAPGAAVSCRVVAAELGLGHAAVRQRASRATRRLAAAVAEYAATEAPLAA